MFKLHRNVISDLVLPGPLCMGDIKQISHYYSRCRMEGPSAE